MGTDSPSIPATITDALPNLRTGRLARGDDVTRHRPAEHLIAQRRVILQQHTRAALRGQRYRNPEEKALKSRIFGARAVARELWELVAQHPVWHVLQSIQVSPVASSLPAEVMELDQLVMGPGGVFTIDAVDRPVQDVSTVSALQAAHRTQDILVRATRVPITVRPLVVLVRSQEQSADKTEEGVDILTVDTVVHWLQKRQAVLTQREVEIVHLAARDRQTWNR